MCCCFWVACVDACAFCSLFASGASPVASSACSPPAPLSDVAPADVDWQGGRRGKGCNKAERLLREQFLQ